MGKAAFWGGVVLCLVGCSPDAATRGPTDPSDLGEVEIALRRALDGLGFDGRVEETLEARLGRPIDPELAELGRLLFFDPVLSLSGDNSCSGCHGPNTGFADSRSISIGVGNNGIVGPGRTGPFNRRRAPTVINSVFYPRLMWDSRFSSDALDPFDNSNGYTFPPPDGRSLSHLEHLLTAQVHTPVANRMEMAGFDFVGGAREMRDSVAARVDAVPEYRDLFGAIYPEVANGEAIPYDFVAFALTEFLFTLVRADAPIDRFARGDDGAMTLEQKRGGVTFFKNGLCAECHIVQSFANQMFSDFEPRAIGVPQLMPVSTNADFDGPGGNEDFGFELLSGNPNDRYEFRTSPLRNLAFQPAYMHNGVYVCIEDAIRHHLEVGRMAREYRPTSLGPDLQGTMGPLEPVLAKAHKLVRDAPSLTEQELRDLVAFVRDALSDPAAAPDRLRHLIPETVPSGLPVHTFDFAALRTRCGA